MTVNLQLECLQGWSPSCAARVGVVCLHLADGGAYAAGQEEAVIDTKSQKRPCTLFSSCFSLSELQMNLITFTCCRRRGFIRRLLSAWLLSNLAGCDVPVMNQERNWPPSAGATSDRLAVSVVTRTRVENTLRNTSLSASGR